MPANDPTVRATTNKRWYERNKDKIKVRRKSHNVNLQNRKDYMKVYTWKYHLKKKYNLTVDQYELLLKAQNNTCPICKSIFDSAAQATKPCVDHDHATGQVRQILCNN